MTEGDKFMTPRKSNFRMGLYYVMLPHHVVLADWLWRMYMAIFQPFLLILMMYAGICVLQLYRESTRKRTRG